MDPNTKSCSEPCEPSITVSRCISVNGQSLDQLEEGSRVHAGTHRF